jgi:hypothetical protein
MVCFPGFAMHKWGGMRGDKGGGGNTWDGIEGRRRIEHRRERERGWKGVVVKGKYEHGSIRY